MCKNKHAINGSLLHVAVFGAAVLATTLISGSVFAAPVTDKGLVAGEDDVRWEYELTTDSSNAVNPQELTIHFYDKPVDLSTVSVPSLSYLISHISGATNDLDTYFLKDADTAAQNTAYGSANPRRTPEVDTTVLDMTDTSKIQIRGVKPIIDPEVETELVFGENMVIGDTFEKYAKLRAYETISWYSYSNGNGYWNLGNGSDRLLDFTTIPGWDSMTLDEQINYQAKVEDFGCIDTNNLTPDYVPEAGKCYAQGSSYSPQNQTTFFGGAFSGYKLKLTNFEASNFNYVGYQAFKDSTFNEANTTMTIDGNSLKGGFIFQNTNIKKAIINTEAYGDDLFNGCSQLTEVTIADSVTKLNAGVFAGTGLTAFDFSSTNIKRIGARAFNSAQLTEVNFGGINRIDYAAFQNNHLTEIYLPKSINYLQSNLFYNNPITKATVAYDTLTSGTTLPFYVVLDGYMHGNTDPKSANNSLQDLTVLAPYAANEPVSATHVTHDDYRWHYDPYTQEHLDEWKSHDGGTYGWASFTYYQRKHFFIDGKRDDQHHYDYEFEDDYADVDSKKNVIAPLYFSDINGLKKITIGDGYEYIGGAAFWNLAYNSFGYTWQSMLGYNRDGSSCYTYGSQTYCNNVKSRRIEEIRLPEGLKGIGNLAFEDIWYDGIKLNLPRSLEFIGIAAFRKVWQLNTDFDLPNIKYIGDYAFESTMLKNITLNDKIYYIGDHAFSNIPTIENITIDFDIFDPDLMIVDFNENLYNYSYGDSDEMWIYENGQATPSEAGFKKNHQRFFKQLFGEFYSMWYGNQTDIDRWGVKRDKSEISGSWHQKFDKITFTDKVVHEMPVKDIVDGYVDKANTSHSSLGDSWGANYDVFFGYMIADEIDLSATAWKVIPRNFFNQAKIDKIDLPENLEVIGHHAFSSVEMQEELIIPDTVKVIGDKAFECWRLTNESGVISNAANNGYTIKTPIITKLPSSLEYIGFEAFWGDDNLTADLNAPNLKHIGTRAFMNTGVRDVLIPSGVTSLMEGTFASAPNLRNVTIDADLGSIAGVEDGSNQTLPQHFVEWAKSEERAWSEINSKDIQICIGMVKGELPYGDDVDDPYYCSGYNKYENGSRTMYFTVGDKFDTFYTIFSKNMQARSGEYTEDGQLTSGDTYGTLTFGPHATTEVDSMIGLFSGLTFEKVDLGQAGWKKLSKNTDAFYKSKIGTLILPQNIETINYASFMKAEVTNPVTLPASLRTIDTSAFQWSKIGGLDIKEGLETINNTAFLWSEIGGEFALPNSLRIIGDNAFQWGKGKITNMLPEGVQTIGSAAFFAADWGDNLTIPSTVTSIGSSAFNAEGADVEYNNVSIKPDLTSQNASGQLVHQLLWKVKINDTLNIESNTLVGYGSADVENRQEFYNLKMKKVILKNLPTITRAAFDKCSNLEEVDMSKNANIRNIMRYAFDGDEKLHIIKFSPAIKNADVLIGERAFAGTGFETMGNNTKDFDLTAAKFDATAGAAFTEMPNLRSVDIPRNFSLATVPVDTFKNDSELREVTVDYKVTLIDDGAFANDTKLEKIFIWGNTVVKDDDFAGYEEPDWFGRGGDDDDNTAGTSVDSASRTIPGQADVYAYSVSPTEAYAKLRGNENLTGTFYPLDEVLYLTSNKPTVLLNDDETDFDKSNLIVYGLRRDGVVLESDSWAEYDGVAFARSARPLTFEKMAATIEADPAFGTVYDTPVPLAELDFGNENFADIDFAIVPAQDDPAVRIVNIVYTDGYTGGEPDTDIDPRQEQEPEPIEPTPTPDPEPETPETPETPKTHDELGQYIALLAGSTAAGLGLIGWGVLSRRTRR